MIIFNIFFDQLYAKIPWLLILTCSWWTMIGVADVLLLWKYSHLSQELDLQAQKTARTSIWMFLPACKNPSCKTRTIFSHPYVFTIVTSWKKAMRENSILCGLASSQMKISTTLGLFFLSHKLPMMEYYITQISTPSQLRGWHYVTVEDSC